MSQNSDAVKGAYDAFNKGDVDGIAAVFAVDARWEGPNTDGVPMSGTSDGKDAVLQALGQIGGTSARYLLEQALGDADAGVREAAKQMLAEPAFAAAAVS